MKDKGKIIYDLKGGKFGEFKIVADYSKFEERYISEDEIEEQDKFYSSRIFVKELVGNSHKNTFWACLSNYDIAFNKKEVEEHFNKKIKQLKEELDIWEQYKEMMLKKADKHLKPFEDLKQSTNYFDYIKK